MASDQAVMDVFGAAMWDAKPTVTDLKALHLAEALGYPSTWRVVRTIEEVPAPKTEGEENPGTQKCVVDRIYAGKPGTGCDMWFHHHAAMMVAQNWETEETAGDPFAEKGGHLLPRQPLYNKGDKVEVFFEDTWYEAKIIRRKEHSEGYRYSVHYTVDKTKQPGIPEEIIRPLDVDGKDPAKVAEQLGFGEGWQAVSSGNNRWKITSPSGVRYYFRELVESPCLVLY